MLKREAGNGLQALLPSSHSFHSFAGSLASPANLQLNPTMAIGTFEAMAGYGTVEVG
jgi:carbonic anhydrase